MPESELREAERDIREVMRGSALQWVLDEVDAAVEAGVPEEKVLVRRRQRSTATDIGLGLAAEAERYELVYRGDVGAAEYAASRKRGTLVISTRPMSTLERVQVLLDALRRVLLELPEIETEALKALLSVPEGEPGDRTPVTSVRFEPVGEVRERTEGGSELSMERLADVRQRLSSLFALTTAEVNE